MRFKNTIFILIFILTGTTVYAQTGAVTFRVYVPEHTPLNDSIYIVGDNINLGNWNPGKVELEKETGGYFEKRIEFGQGTQIEFKITRGSWDTEAVSKAGIVPGNRMHKVGDNELIEIHIEEWKDFRHTIEGGITGDIKFHREFESKKVKNRDVLVLLPKSYNTAKDKKYPVLYMHDGQNCFDPKTSYSNIDWQIDERSDSLSAIGEMEEIIIAAINNTDERMQEYGNTPKGLEYLDFIIEELKPFIDSNYRTKPDKHNTALMGSSMGGLISYLGIWYHPEVFGKAACLSISLSPRLVDHKKFFDLAKEFHYYKRDLKIYIDTGDEYKDDNYAKAYDKLKNTLLSLSYEEGKDVQFTVFEGHDHSEKSWAKRIHLPLLFLFGK